MREPLSEKIRRIIILPVLRFIGKFTGHYHGCCDNWFKSCDKCLSNREY